MTAEQNNIPHSKESDFHNHGLTALKAMIEESKPENVKKTAQEWKEVADELAGGSGDGGIRKSFKSAIDHALAHWRGPASEKFREEAEKVLSKIDRAYGHARNAERAMRGAAEDLGKAQGEMAKIKEPSFGDRVGDWWNDEGRDPSQYNKDLASSKYDTDAALERNREYLSLTKERHLEAVVVMEALAYNYKGHAAVIKAPRHVIDDGDWPAEPNNVPSPPPIALPTVMPRSPNGQVAGGGGGGKGTVGTIPSSKPVESPRDSAVIGGSQKPVSGPKQPIGTVIDGVSGGVTGPAAGGTTGGAGPSGPSSGGIVGSGPGGIIGGARGGVGGARGVSGKIGGGPTRGVTGGATGAGRGATAGRPGMPGAGGVAGGPGRQGGAAASRSGGLARQGGGVVGGAKGTGGTGRGTAGGSGLHRSRGAQQAVGKSGRPGGQMGAGVPRTRNDRANEEERREGVRPDYLVEDEETWAPQRNTAPRVVE
ncbi:WXG100 family type VII secretion target [Streptomyces thermolineatus]|uniref:WXG100 family type VII secretion target n=1 Tax=Streptomyces thermolineatus TaxID=44033 RepID=UPI00384D221B